MWGVWQQVRSTVLQKPEITRATGKTWYLHLFAHSKICHSEISCLFFLFLCRSSSSSSRVSARPCCTTLGATAEAAIRVHVSFKHTDNGLPSEATTAAANLCKALQLADGEENALGRWAPLVVSAKLQSGADPVCPTSYSVFFTMTIKHTHKNTEAFQSFTKHL